MNKNIIFTGIIICLLFVLPAAASDYTLGIYGNANEDNTINMQDIIYTEMIIRGYKDRTELADANHDGMIDILDVTQIELTILGNETELTIVDDVGNVTVPQPINSFVYHGENSNVYETLRAIDAIGGNIGISHRFTDPTGCLYSNAYYPELCGLTDIGMFIMPDYGVVKMLGPYVVISDAEWFYDRTKTPGIPVVALDVQPANFREATMKFGYIFDRVDEAEEYIDWYNDLENEVIGHIEGIPAGDKPRVLYIDSYSPGATVLHVPAKDNYRAEMVRRAGGDYIGDYIAGSGMSEMVNVSWVIEEDPEVIILSAEPQYVGYDVVSPSNAITLINDFTSRPDFAGVSAVKNNRVYVVSHAFIIHGGASGLIGTTYYAEWMHPGMASDATDEHQEFVTRFQRITGLAVDTCYSVYPASASAPVPKEEAVAIATKFAGLKEVTTVHQPRDIYSHTQTFNVMGNDSKGDILIGIDPTTGEVIKMVKQCPYPGRDTESVEISGEDAVRKAHEFLSNRNLPPVPEGFIMEEPMLITTWTKKHWEVVWRHYDESEVEVLSDFISFMVNPETGEIASYSKVHHDVVLSYQPEIGAGEAIECAMRVFWEGTLEGYDPGMEVLKTTLKILYPNNYFEDFIYHWNDHQALAWVVQFGENGEPAIDIWIDALSGELLGGEIYERPVPDLWGIPDQHADVTNIWEPALDAMQFDTTHTFLTDTTDTAVVQSIQNCAYFILHTHAAPNLANLAHHPGGQNTKLLDPSEIPNNNLRYALLSTCSSGVTTAGSDFWEVFINGGTDVFHGYAAPMNPDYYEMALTRYLAVGASLWNAHVSAIADTNFKHAVFKYGPPLYCWNQLYLAPLFVKTTSSVQGNIITITVDVENNEEARKSAATNVNAQLIAPVGFIITGANPQTTPSLAYGFGNTWTAQWNVQAPAGASGPQTFDVIVQSDNLGVAVDDYAQATTGTPHFHPVTVNLTP